MGPFHRNFIRLFVFILAAAGAAFAAPQSLVSVEGTVTDKTQAIVPGARVTLRDAQFIRSTTTDGVGHFRFDNVPVGNYKLTVDLAGFESQVQQIVVAGGSTISTPVELQAAGGNETINVTAAAIYTETRASSATKTDTPLRDIPQAVSVVNQELIRTQAATSIQDVVRNVSGVTLHLGEGRRDQVYIRGFSAVNDQFIDGVRDDAPYYRDLSSLERVEVIKGPAAALYGRGSSGGIINRITKTPQTEGLLAEFSTIVGSYGTKRVSTDLGASTLKNTLAFRLTGAYEDSGSYRHSYYLDRYDLAPSVLWRPSEKTQVLYQMEHLHDDRLPDRGIPSVDGLPANVDLGTYYGYPQDDYLNNRVNSQSLKVEHSFSDWTVRNFFRYTGYNNTYSNTLASGTTVVAGSIFVKRQQYNSDSDQRNYFNQTEAIKKSRLFGMTHTVLLGTEFGTQYRDTIRFDGTAANVPLINPVLTRPVYSLTPTSDNFFDGNVWAGYVQDQVDIAPKWKATLGARFDYFKQLLDDRRPANVDLGRIDRQWSPRAGLVYQPTSAIALYGSFSRSFQPSGEGLSLAANNEDLKPEVTQNYEVGSKFDFFSGRVSSTVSVFRLNRSNIKTTDPIDPTKLVLVGEQKTDGLELSLSGRLARGWNVYGGYAWLATRILRSNSLSNGVATEGKRAAHIPLNSANLWSTYSFDNGFGFGGGLLFNDDRFTANDNLVTLPGYLRLDATAFYKQRHYEIALNLRNIANTKYFETAQSNFQIYPGTPISGLLTLRYRW